MLSCIFVWDCGCWNLIIDTRLLNRGLGLVNIPQILDKICINISTDRNTLVDFFLSKI